MRQGFIILKGIPNDKIDMSIKKVFIRRNVWDNYALFIGTKKVLDGARKDDLIERCQELYPNAEIIDKTI